MNDTSDKQDEDQLSGQTGRRYLTDRIGAFEMEYSLLREFFQYQDTLNYPCVTNPQAKSYILSEIGFCLIHLGQLEIAEDFYKRAILLARDQKDWGNISTGYGSLAGLHCLQGDLNSMKIDALEGLNIARLAEGKKCMFNEMWTAPLIVDG